MPIYNSAFPWATNSTLAVTSLTTALHDVATAATTAWYQIDAASTNGLGTWAGWNVTYAQTAAEKEAARKLRCRQRQHDARTRRLGLIARKEADKRALTLLMENLDPAQQVDYLRTSAFTVHAPSGRRYCIKRGMAGNVALLNDEGLPVRRYCCHVFAHVPVDDNVLTQKLALELNEEAFLLVANATPVRV